MSVPRIPYGWAKRIVRTMRIGDNYVIRPAYGVAFHNAARRLGVRVILKPFRRDGKLMYQLKRVSVNAPSAHAHRGKDKQGHFVRV